MELGKEIEQLLNQLDDEFHPPLSSYMDIKAYVAKIIKHATVFSVHIQGELAAFIAVYCNDEESLSGYMTILAVSKSFRKKKIAINLVETSIAHLKAMGFETYRLEVYKTNPSAIKLYQKLGFETTQESDRSLFMELRLSNS